MRTEYIDSELRTDFRVPVSRRVRNGIGLQQESFVSNADIPHHGTVVRHQRYETVGEQLGVMVQMFGEGAVEQSDAGFLMIQNRAFNQVTDFMRHGRRDRSGGVRGVQKNSGLRRLAEAKFEGETPQPQTGPLQVGRSSNSNRRSGEDLQRTGEMFRIGQRTPGSRTRL